MEIDSLEMAHDRNISLAELAEILLETATEAVNEIRALERDVDSGRNASIAEILPRFTKLEKKLGSWLKAQIKLLQRQQDRIGALDEDRQES